jgi:hypothetical protein
MKTRYNRVIALGVLILVLVRFIGTRADAQPATNEPLIYCVTNAPIIYCHPEAQAVLVGTTNVTFSVVAEPPPPILSYQFTYQWQTNHNPGRSNYVDISSATNDTYTIPHAVTTNDVAYYRVIVSGLGTTISEPAPLLVAWTGNSFTFAGTPVVSSGNSGSSCPGAYAGYVRYWKNPGWGWAPTNTVHTATDPQRDDTKVEASGQLWDLYCNTDSVTVPHPTTSPKYRFAIYFPNNVPSGSYNITLEGFVQ